MGTTMRKATQDDIKKWETLHLVLDDGSRRLVLVEDTYGDLDLGILVSDDTGSGILWGSTVAAMLACGRIEVIDKDYGWPWWANAGRSEPEPEPEPEPEAKPFRVAFWTADERAGWGDEQVQAVAYLDTREEALWWELDRMDDWQAAPTSARAGVTVGYLQPDGTYKQIGQSDRTAPTMRHALETCTDRLGRAIL